MPEISSAILQQTIPFFEGSNGSDSPYTDQAAGFVPAGAADLNGKPKHLGEENSYQDADVAITV